MSKKDFDDHPSIDSNENGTSEAEKLPYSKQIGEESSEESPSAENSSKERHSEEDSSREGDAEDGTSRRRKRIKVTVRRPDALEQLAEMLGSSKAGVYNTALGLLAEKMGAGQTK